MAAATKLTNATYNVTTDWQTETQADTALKKGEFNMSFSEMTTTSAPVIQAGSSVDIDGTIYLFETNESPTGAISSGVNYVRVLDSASTGVAEFTDTAPATYDYLRKGFYDGTGAKRYVMRFTSTGADYSDKKLMINSPALYLENDLHVAGEFNGAPSYGGVGTITIATSSDFAVSTEYLPNTTYAGSTLYRSTVTGAGIYAPFNARDNGSVFVDSANQASLGLVGTWRLLTRVYRGSGATTYPMGLFQRIS